jgi:hypothetical protein
MEWFDRRISQFDYSSEKYEYSGYLYSDNTGHHEHIITVICRHVVL